MPRLTRERDAHNETDTIEGIPSMLRWIAAGLCLLAFLASAALVTFPYFERLFR